MPFLASTGGTKGFGRGRVIPLGYQIARSLRFDSADSSYLNRTFPSAGNRRTWTFSCWFKPGKINPNDWHWLFNTNTNGGFLINYDTGYAQSQLAFYDNGGAQEIKFNGSFYDTTAWYHLIFTYDTTQATQANRSRAWVNSMPLTKSVDNGITLNLEGSFNNNVVHSIGRWENGASRYLNGYLAEVNFVGGSALTPSSFGEIDSQTGAWKPKQYTGSYGTNGFYLNFSDNSGTTSTTLGKDQAGSNNWTPNNFSITAGSANDSLVDTPTPYGSDSGVGGEVRGNYCILNQLDGLTNVTLSNANLHFSTNNANRSGIKGSMELRSGKWYFELYKGTNNSGSIGVAKAEHVLTQDGYAGDGTTSWGYLTTGSKRYNSSDSSYGDSWQSGVTVGCAVDLDNSKIWFSRNGVWQASGDPAAGTNAAFTNVSGPVMPVFYTGGGPDIVNFGQRPFAYTAPAGFKALSTRNLTVPTIVNPSDGFQALYYSGNGSSSRSFDIGFRPEIVWIKTRSGSDATFYHRLAMSTMPDNNYMSTHVNEGLQNAINGYIDSYDSTGFTVTKGGGGVNESGSTYSAYCWKAGGTPTTVQDSNGANFTRTVDSTYGLSVISYAGNGLSRNIPHGLAAAPDFIMIKGNQTSDWRFYVSTFTDPGHLLIQTTDTLITGHGYLRGTRPDATNLYLPNTAYNGHGSAWETNTNGVNYYAALWKSVDGFSKFGEYSGNSSGATFVNVGFQPSLVVIKPKSTDVAPTTGWRMFDNASTLNAYSPGTGTRNALYWTNANGEVSQNGIDFFSNGFVINAAGASDQNINRSGCTYVYFAFAENPAKYSLGGSTNI